MKQLRETSSLPITLAPQGVLRVKAEQVMPERMPMPGMMEFLGDLQQTEK